MSRDEDDRSAPEVVDFHALHAALGDLPQASQPSSPNVGDSQGRKNATYASTRPHAIPQTRSPVTELDAPAVIVQPDDTVPTGPPIQMTVPMAGAPAFGQAAPRPRVDRSGATRSPFGPAPFADEPTVGQPLPTRPRRPRTPTLVMRPRGPTTLQKVIVFIAMLVVFVAGGVAFLVYGKAIGLDIDVPMSVAPAKAPRPPVVSTVAETAAAPIPPPALSAVSVVPPVVTSALPIPSASVSALPTASVKKPPRRPPPPPPVPTPAPPPAVSF